MTIKDKMSKINCWEIKKCGREPGGSKRQKLEVCPAATDTSCDGINSGKNAGRICRVIAGTLCDGEVQSDFSQKPVSCLSCEVYKQVEAGEGAVNFTLLKSGWGHLT